MLTWAPDAVSREVLRLCITVMTETQRMANLQIQQAAKTPAAP
jgi:hypothetical protein